MLNTKIITSLKRRALLLSRLECWQAARGYFMSFARNVHIHYQCKIIISAIPAQNERGFQFQTTIAVVGRKTAQPAGGRRRKSRHHRDVGLGFRTPAEVRTEQPEHTQLTNVFLSIPTTRTPTNPHTNNPKPKQTTHPTSDCL